MPDLLLAFLALRKLRADVDGNKPGQQKQTECGDALQATDKKAVMI